MGSPKRIVILSTILFLSFNAEVLCARGVKLTPYGIYILTTMCEGRGSCQARGREPEDLSQVDCHCGENCSKLNTCCFDSVHRLPNGSPSSGFKCVTPYGSRTKPLFMMDRCVSDNPEVQELCQKRREDDPFTLVPVTSPKTGITYRNFFCFACNENPSSVSPILWDIHLYHRQKNFSYPPIQQLRYNRELKEWTIGGVKVYPSMKIPKKIENFATPCEEGVIETCAWNWPNPKTKEKCGAFMGLVRIYDDLFGQVTTYRNFYCAICNYQNPFRRKCKPVDDPHSGGGLRLFVGLFSFDDKEHKCPRGMVFDDISNKCRGFVCGRNQIAYRGFCR